MKSKVICKGVKPMPESQAPDSRMYWEATFKRVGLVKGKIDEETERVVKEHPSVRIEFATWGPEPSPFKAGEEYIVEITPCKKEGE